MKKSQVKSKRGFTLIELLVSVAIFATIATIVCTMFISTSKSQYKVLNSQELLDQSSYLMEYMSRAIRMAVKDVAGDCINPYTNYRTNAEKDRIEFMNSGGYCREISRKENDSVYGLKEEIKDQFGVEIREAFLTSPDLNLASFRVAGEDSWDQPPLDFKQPRVTIFLELEGIGQRPEFKPHLNIQTTISQRNFDYEVGP